MNRIFKLYDETYIRKLFMKEVLPLYKGYSAIKTIAIEKHKTNIWEQSYHVVVGYDIILTGSGKGDREALIFCVAHSSEPRKNVYKTLKYLWDGGFSEECLTIPRPLFYSGYFKGTFYEGVRGRNLYQYIREGDSNEVREVVPLAAKWFAKLHQLPKDKELSISNLNRRIRTVIPGAKHVLERIEKDYKPFHELGKKVYKTLIAKEENFLKSTKKRWVIHGDAHPENIIRMDKGKIGVIDFADICFSDFCRDIGCFMQQLDYMINRKLNDEKFANEIKDLFLLNYAESAKIEIDDEIQSRIETYYDWTTMRTASFFLLKDNPEPDRAEDLLKKLQLKYL